jgi:hypothetical protein
MLGWPHIAPADVRASQLPADWGLWAPIYWEEIERARR